MKVKFGILRSFRRPKKRPAVSGPPCAASFTVEFTPEDGPDRSPFLVVGSCVLPAAHTCSHDVDFTLPGIASCYSVKGHVGENLLLYVEPELDHREEVNVQCT